MPKYKVGDLVQFNYLFNPQDTLAIVISVNIYGELPDNNDYDYTLYDVMGQRFTDRYEAGIRDYI
jgi:hypothetical protein